MNFSFLRYFKRDKGAQAGGVAVAPAPIVPIEKPASERFGKTVRPNSSRIVALEPSETFPVAAPGGEMAMGTAPAASAPAFSGSPRISLGCGGALTTEMSGPGPSGADRTIALQLTDLVPHIPGGMLAPAEIDPHRRVLLKASELERGMASGRPTVLLRAIYQQAPEFFSGEVKEDDKTEVALPFGKVLEQFASFQLRPDQVCEAAVPEMETPFLQATIEDSKRFGTPITSLAKAPIAKASVLPTPAAPTPTKSEPPIPPKSTAPTLPVAAENAPAHETAPAPAVKPIKPIRLTLPSEEKASAPVAPAPARPEPPPSRPPIAVNLSPNGTGVPATERVPASSGPSVPTPLPSPLAPASARIPFKISPPSNDLREPPAPIPPAPQLAAARLGPGGAGPRVRLSLRNVLRDIPPFQLSGPIDEVPESAQIEFAFAIVAPQLSLGKVSLSPAQFQAALPEEFRTRFTIEDSETPIALPLQEVLQNLPNESLQLRGDQEAPEITEAFETPFSKKAAEDAERFKKPSAPSAKPTPPADVAAVSTATAKAAPGPAVEFTAQVAWKPDASPVRLAGAVPPGTPIPAITATAAESTDRPDPKAIVAKASQLPGVKACAVVFSDGLSLAGNIPPDCGAEGLCAMAPSLMKRIADQIAESNLGSLEGLTLFCTQSPISFFAQGGICLAALHSKGELPPETRRRLSTTAEELAQTYRQPA